MNITPYSVLMAAGIAGSLVFWVRLAKRDDRLLAVYLSALFGAFIGAKISYIIAEGWMHFGAPDMWLQLATGKSIVGALIGGYLSVEGAKRLLGYKGITGDWFATIVPLAIALGRVGCLIHGCCLGRICDRAEWWTLRDSHGLPRWPAVPVEMGFNLLAAAVFTIFRRRKILPGQHFHLYMIFYGVFRFIHEGVRDTPRITGGLSGYQFEALLLTALGMSGFLIRKHFNGTNPEGAANPRAAAQSR